MFCPKCATQNVDGAHFCRSCGANISLVPQALTGQLPPTQPREEEYFGRRWGRRPPSIDYAVRSLMSGIAFAVIAVMVFKFSPGSAKWWFWLLLPAIMWFGRGFSELIRVNRKKEQAQTTAQPQLNTVRLQEIPAPKTGELRPPLPSVTEGTTRHLATEARTQHLDSNESQNPY